MLKAVPSTAQGEIGFVSSKADISIADVELTNLDTGETIRTAAIHLHPDAPQHLLATTDWTNYRVSFRAMRNMDCAEKHYVGGRGFSLEFGRKDENNLLRWIIDGWTNMFALAQIRDGQFAEMTHCMASPRKGEWHEYILEVRGDVISISPDGKTCLPAVLRQPDIEPLYTAASIDESTGDLIVKEVNLQSVPAQATLTLEHFTAASVQVTELSGFQKDDVNTFDEPFKVAPREYNISAQPSMEWVFPPESMTILRFRQR